LPTYPFERKRYWIERPVAAGDQRLAQPVSQAEVIAPGNGTSHPKPAPSDFDSGLEQVVEAQLRVMGLQLDALHESVAREF
jgi:hypothetical protein